MANSDFAGFAVALTELLDEWVLYRQNLWRKICQDVPGLLRFIALGCGAGESSPGCWKEQSAVPVLMELSRVIISEINDQQAIYLKEVGGTRTFPILIGPFEAQIINRRLLEEPPFRPLTHDLMKNIMETLGGIPEKVLISDMKEHTYYAVLQVRAGEIVLDIDCRPSDAIALAVHYSPPLPIEVAEHVLAVSG